MIMVLPDCSVRSLVVVASTGTPDELKLPFKSLVGNSAADTKGKSADIDAVVVV